MDSPYLLTTPLTDRKSDLWILYDIGVNKIKLPERGLESLVTKSALETLEKAANQEYMTREIDDETYLQIHCGLEKIRLVLEKQFDFVKGERNVLSRPFKGDLNELPILVDTGRKRILLPESGIEHLISLETAGALEELAKSAKNSGAIDKKTFKWIERGLTELAFASVKGKTLDADITFEETPDIRVNIPKEKEQKTAHEQKENKLMREQAPAISKEHSREFIQSQSTIGLTPSASKVGEIMNNRVIDPLTERDLKRAIRHMQFLFRAHMIDEKTVDLFLKGVEHHYNRGKGAEISTLKKKLPVSTIRELLKIRPEPIFDNVKRVLGELVGKSSVDKKLLNLIGDWMNKLDDRFSSGKTKIKGADLAERLIDFIYLSMIFRDFGNFSDISAVKRGLALMDPSDDLAKLLPNVAFVKTFNELAPLIAVIKEQIFITDSEKMKKALALKAEEPAKFTLRYGKEIPLQERYQLIKNSSLPGYFIMKMESTIDGKQVKTKESILDLRAFIKAGDPQSILKEEELLLNAVRSPTKENLYALTHLSADEVKAFTSASLDFIENAEREMTHLVRIEP